MKKRFGVVHAIAECEDCNWTTQSFKNAQAIAAKHAAYHKHKVHVDIGIAGFYDGRES